MDATPKNFDTRLLSQVARNVNKNYRFAVRDSCLAVNVPKDSFSFQNELALTMTPSVLPVSGLKVVP